ncbi:MAG TPA: tetratricopeptide repeat protein [Bryobacteraceae bacterium]|nr:tetratricopeptide repeat protein [Bryobacteraceae bacterium]
MTLLQKCGAGAGACLVLSCAMSAQTLQQAEALWKAHDYINANSAFQTLVNANPDNAQYRVRWGQFYAERYYPDEASKLFQEAIALDPKNAQAYLGLARVYEDSFSSKANEAADKALALDPKLYEADELKARIALEDDDHAKAVAAADAALAINPDAVIAIAIHASIDLLADKESPWVAKIGNRGVGYETIAHFFVINRRYFDGIAYYKKAIAATPDLWSAHSQLGVNLMRMGQDGEAYKELELAYNNDHSSDASTRNSLKLLDTYKNYKTYETPTTILKLDKKEAEALRPYFEDAMKFNIALYEKKYQYKLKEPVQVEVYPNHEDFAVRTLGLPGLGALGVTFDTVVAMDSPSGRPPGEFHWASTLRHEMSHVYILKLTNDRVPRWFTEGVAVHEETATTPDWGDRITPEIVVAIRDKKLLPVAQIDRGFVHPEFPAQVIVSYFEAGKMCDYIAARWGESKLLDMAHEFANNVPTVKVIKDQLKIEPEEFDKDFLASVNKETETTVKNFETWTKGLGEINKLARQPDANKDDLIAKGRILEAFYPDFVETGNAYLVVAKACLAREDKQCAMDEYARYSKNSGRDADAVKQYAKLLDEAGKPKEAEAALERLNFVNPLDADLHEKLGTLYLKTKDAPLAVREFGTLVALHPIDAAGSHYNLAMAYNAQGQKDKAREEALNALEAAPNFKPAQKLLLQVSGDAGKDTNGEGTPK